MGDDDLNWKRTQSIISVKDNLNININMENELKLFYKNNFKKM